MTNAVRRILIVDDENPIADMIGDFCASIGHETRVLNDGETVMNVVREFKPDLILLDLIMPNVSGIEVMENLSADPIAKSIPVIIISSIANGVSAEGILKECKAILAKPIKIRTLQDNIQQALSPK